MGTYANPVTFATDVSELGWCQVIYVPYMKRYFIHEDECSECDADWTRSHLYRFDMWAGGDANSRKAPEKKALHACESTWTRADSVTDPANPTVIVDPPPGLPVTTAPIFSGPTQCWTPIALDQSRQADHGARQRRSACTSGPSTPRPARRCATAASGLPAGLSINAASGLISGRPRSPRGRST